MKRLLTETDVAILNHKLNSVLDTKNIINDVELNIIGGDTNNLMHSDVISVDQIELTLGQSDLADSISIDTTGRVYLEGEHDRLTSPYIDELVTISQIGIRLNTWFNNLPIDESK